MRPLQHMEALRERLCKESAAAESEWANASKVLSDARTKDDDLRAEVKWRVAEKQAAERAVAEAESRHAIAAAALIQAEKQSLTAAATLAQKQALLGQLWDHEAQLLQQSKMAEEAKLEAQQAKANAKEGQQRLEEALQDLRSIRAQHEHEKYIAQALQEQNRKLTADLSCLEELRKQDELNRSQLELIKADKDILEREVRSHQSEKEILSEKCSRAEVQLLEMKSREDRMSGQLSVLQEALRTAQNDAAALRARLESRRSGCIEGPDPASSVRGAQLCPPDGRKASETGCQPQAFQPWESMQAMQGLAASASGVVQTPDPPSNSGPPAKTGQDETKDEEMGGDGNADDPVPGHFPDTQIGEDAPAKRPRKAEPQVGQKVGQNVEGVDLLKKALNLNSPGSSLPSPFRSLGEPHVTGQPYTPQSPPRERPNLSRQRGFMGLTETSGPRKPNKLVPGEHGRAAKRSKEEVERLAHSMFYTKPQPRQLRAPPLKLYPAHIEYVLSNWDAYIAKYGHGDGSNGPASLASKLERERSNASKPEGHPAPGAWQAVQDFLKASASESPHSPQRMRYIVSRACEKKEGGGGKGGKM